MADITNLPRSNKRGGIIISEKRSRIVRGNGNNSDFTKEDPNTLSNRGGGHKKVTNGNR